MDSVMLPAHAQTSMTPPSMGCGRLVIPATDQLCLGFVTLTRYWFVDDSGSCPALVPSDAEPASAIKIEITQQVTTGASILSIIVISGTTTATTTQDCSEPSDPFTGTVSSLVDAVGSTRKFRVEYSRSIDSLGAHISQVIITPV